MVKRADTQENLSVISGRNDGRRRSLAIDDDYQNDSSEDGIGGFNLHSENHDDDDTQSNHGDDREDNSSDGQGDVFNDIPTPTPTGVGDSSIEFDQKLKHRKHPLKNLDVTVEGSDTEITAQDMQDVSGGAKKSQSATPETDADMSDIVAKYASSDHKQIRSTFNILKNFNLARLNKKAKSDKDNKYRSQFGDVKFYTHSSTIFDASYFKNSEFFGMYVLFWLGTTFLMFNSMVHSYFEHTEWFYNSPVINTLKKDIFKVGLTDLAMYLTTYMAFFIQWLCLKGYLRWSTSGWIIQLVYDFIHLSFWLVFASDLMMGYTWIAKVFLVLHNLVFLMKMHSYAFYNGYLWRVLGELKVSQDLLDRIDDGSAHLPADYDQDNARKILIDSITFCKFELEYQSNATTLSTDITVDPKDVENEDIDQLQQKNIVKFPANINLFNFFEYTMFPTVVYTLNFPRTPRIRRRYVAEKIIGTFGIIFLMVLVAQNWLYPLVLQALEARTLPYYEKSKAYIFILLDMMPPFLLIYLLTFFLIWDAILNAIAELSRFADRDFYGPWWSCTDWSEYARIWNRPVHKFLLRHVYHSSISALSLNKVWASIFTFMLSSLVHELVMFVIFGKLRGYLLILQMSQIPLVMISRTRFMKDKKVLGNVICWFGFISGPSMICTLYLIF